jgi:hypothetical protein
MDDHNLQSELADFRVSFPGPFAQHDVVVDGWRVPLVHAQVHGEDMCDPGSARARNVRSPLSLPSPRNRNVQVVVELVGVGERRLRQPRPRLLHQSMGVSALG